MAVRLVSYSKPTMEFIADGISNDNMLDLVAYCARVSNPANQMNSETSEKLNIPNLPVPLRHAEADQRLSRRTSIEHRGWS